MQLTTTSITSLKLSKPAHRALENAGISTLKQLAKFRESEILKLHGIGKASIPAMKQALKTNGLTFANK